MSFEKKMQKRGNKILDMYTPDLYKKNRSFPLWAKIAIPVGGTIATSAVVLAVVISALSPFSSKDVLVGAPKRQSLMSLDTSIVERTATKTLQSLDSFLKDNSGSNYVISPASYLLAVSALAGVSDNFTLDNFGLIDAMADCKKLLESWNFLYEKENEYGTYDYCRFDSGVLFQQVGPTYQFDLEKQKAIADQYIATSVASMNNCHEQARAYYRDKISLNIPTPNLRLTRDAVIAYGAVKMKDYVANGLLSGMKDFYANGTKNPVNSYIFAYGQQPVGVQYYASENYQTFNLKVNHTRLLVVLPNEGVSLESISISEAYESWRTNSKSICAYGYVPYFHISNDSIDISSALANKLNGKEVFYSKLLKDNVINDLKLDCVLQSSDFEFNKFGVSGESITAISTVGQVAYQGESIELNVNRPFYAISLKDNFPLFVNKVINPNG